jgi:hypothetical protein
MLQITVSLHHADVKAAEEFGDKASIAKVYYCLCSIHVRLNTSSE